MDLCITAKRAVVIVLTLSALTVIYLAITGRFDSLWRDIVSEQTHAALFILLFLVLPLLGFPVTVFLLLLGVKFEALTAISVLFGGVAVHVAVCFPAANTILRPVIQRVLRDSCYRLPQLPREGSVWPGILFMAIPGLSYIMKNYLLSLSGMPFRYYFPIGWLVQATMGVPLVLAGDAIGHRYLWFIAVCFALTGATFFIRRQIRYKRARRDPRP